MAKPTRPAKGAFRRDGGHIGPVGLVRHVSDLDLPGNEEVPRWSAPGLSRQDEVLRSGGETPQEIVAGSIVDSRRGPVGGRALKPSGGSSDPYQFPPTPEGSSRSEWNSMHPHQRPAAESPLVE